MGQELQDNISFGKGMIPQVDPINLPEGAYLDALNMMRNEVGVLSTECGTSATLGAIPGTIVGVHSVGDDILICSTDNTLSTIGLIDATNTYSILYSNTILKFNTSVRLGIEYKVDSFGVSVVYIAGEGIKLRRIPISTIIPEEDFDKVTSLFFDYSLPITTLDKVTSGGKVLTGVYQFGVRLITKAGNATGFGPISNTISISDSSIGTDRRDYDGAPPQTPSPNAIQLQVQNIDTSFEYIEPCVITYLGDSNVLSIKALNKISINSRATIPFTYYGTADELDTILQEEVSTDITNYSSAKYIAQKDSTLLLAGLEEEKDIVDWQSVANSIDLKWFVKPVSHIEVVDMSGDSDIGTVYDFEDYKNPNTCNKYVGYKRDEVYSFTFTPIYTSGRKGDAYHIPATFSLVETNNLKSANSVEVYPADFPVSKGVALANTPVRYHKMPDNVDSPFWTLVSNVEYINILGISAHINAAPGWDSTISGYIIGRENRVGKETILAQGFTRDLHSPGGTAIGRSVMPGYGFTAVNLDSAVGEDWKTTDVDKRRFLFHSPDICVNTFVPAAPKNIKSAMQCTSRVHYLYGARNSSEVNVSYTKIFPGTPLNIGTGLKPEYVTSSAKGGREGNLFAPLITFDSVTINNLSSDAGIFLASTSDLNKYRSEVDRLVQNLLFGFRLYGTNSTEGKITLYDLHTENLKLYGSIYNKESIPTKIKLKGLPAISNITGEAEEFKDATFFAGDIYISRFSHTLKWSLGLAGSKYGNILYYMVESANNYNYRHALVTGAGDSDITSVPYYPKDRNIKKLGSELFTLEDVGLYNKQYSAQNTLQPTYTEDITTQTIDNFPNRIIYSATSVEGEQFDAFRLFKINNYHDIPKQYGDITGLFSQGNDLYVHTEKALWKSFYNTLVTQTTSAGEVVLGNGGAFSRPSVPIVSLQGGYAGCKDISASIGTPMGRYFYDFNRSKLYLLGEGLQEVSNPTVFKLLRDTIGSGDVTLGYDYGRKRVLLSSNTGTLSFKPELQSFDSRHSYKFSHFVSRELKDYLISGNTVHYFDDTVVGRFFGVVYNSFLKVASVVNPAISKRYASAEVVLTSQEPATKVNSPWTFFSKLKMYSRERNTGETTFKVNPSFGELEQFGEILVSKANNKFRFGFAPDIVDDINMDIQDPYNLKSHSRFTDEDRIFLPDMIDNHVILEFTIDNNQQKEIKIQSLIINFDQNIT